MNTISKGVVTPNGHAPSGPEGASLQATVRFVRYPAAAEDSGSREFRIVNTDHGIVKGTMGWRPAQGELVKFVGVKQIVHPRYGIGWEFKYAQHIMPTDERAALAYVCSMTHGIGPALEQAIWDMCGEDWRNLSAYSVPRLSAAARDAFLNALAEADAQGERTSAMSYLFSLGCTPHMADVAWERWGLATIATIQENVYALATLPFYSFKDVDTRIDKAQFGITRDNARRIDAAISYVMSQRCQSETTCAWTDLRDALYATIDSDHEAIRVRVSDAFAHGRLVAFRNVNRIATRRDYENEKVIADFVEAE